MEHHRKRLTEHITLEGADGHRWLTMLALQLDSQYCLSIGWKEFAADSNLEINDKVLFLLFEDSHFLVQVFDANNNFKGRVIAPPAKGGDGKVSVVSQAPPARAGDGKVNVVSQAGMQQRKEASVAETTKTKPDQAHRQGTNNPPLYFDTNSVNLSNDRTNSKVDANPALRADSPSVPRSEVNGKDIIEIPDSSEEDEDEHMPVQPLPPTHWDGPVTSVRASGIQMRTKQYISRCSIKLTRVDAEITQTQAPQKDVSDSIKTQTVRQSSRIAEMAEPNNLTQKNVQSDEDQNEGATHIGNGGFKVPGTQPASRSPPSSSPEHVTVMKRPRKLQRKTADDEEDDDDWMPSIRNSVETPTGQLKKDAAAPKANKVTEQENKKNKKKKASTENLPKGMKRTPATPPDSEVLNPTQRAADDGGTEAMPQENGGSKATPPQTPGGVGSRVPVQARHKVKAHKKREKACLPPEESRPPLEEEPKIQYKRPKMTSLRPTRIGTPKARKEHKILFISRRRPVTEQERTETLTKAQEYAQKSINKHFVMQLRETQVYCGYHLVASHPNAELQLNLLQSLNIEWPATYCITGANTNLCVCVCVCVSGSTARICGSDAASSCKAEDNVL